MEVVDITAKPKKMLTEEQKQKRREYNKLYMSKKRLEDPDFVRRQRESCRKSRQRPEAKEKERIRNIQRDRGNYFVERYKKKKEHYEELSKHIDEMEKKIENLNIQEEDKERCDTCNRIWFNCKCGSPCDGIFY